MTIKKYSNSKESFMIKIMRTYEIDDRRPPPLVVLTIQYKVFEELNHDFTNDIQSYLWIQAIGY
jgi:hypothetical protein